MRAGWLEGRLRVVDVEDVDMINPIQRAFSRHSQDILKLPRVYKKLVAISFDAILCLGSTWLAFFLRLGDYELMSMSYWRVDVAVILALSLSIPVFLLNGVYNTIFRYSSWNSIRFVGKSFSVYSCCYCMAVTLYGIEGIPRTIGIIQPLIFYFFLALSRELVGFALTPGKFWLFRDKNRSRAIIYGAGKSGLELCSALRRSCDFIVVGFLDDDERLHGQCLAGIPVSSPSCLDALVKDHKVKHVLLAMPSASRRRRSEIISSLSVKYLHFSP